MGYTLYDFTESLARVELPSPPKRVIRAWGYSPEGYGSWTGGFLVELQDGRFAYLSGWCDTTGWGCQDGVDLEVTDVEPNPQLPEGSTWDNEPVGGWDKDPADLNLWIARGMPRDTGGYPTDD